MTPNAQMGLVGIQASYRDSHSAMPDAPVVEPRPRRPLRARPERTRRALAVTLHRWADAIAPRPVPHQPLV